MRVIANINIQHGEARNPKLGLTVEPGKGAQIPNSYPVGMTLYNRGVLYLTWLILCSSHATAQTTAVTLRTKNEIVIAADSKVGLGGVLTTSGCGTNYDVPVFARGSFHDSDTFADNLSRFETIMARAFKDAIEFYKEDRAKIGITIPDIDRYTLQVLLGTVENGTPLLARRDFVQARSIAGKIEVRIVSWDCPGQCDDEKVAKYQIGHVAAIDDYVVRHPAFLERKPLRTAAAFLVGLEEIAEPKDVGGPIDVLSITKRRAQWVKHKKQCPEIQPIQAPQKHSPKKSATGTAKSGSGTRLR